MNGSTQYTVQFWRWQTFAITEQYSKIIIIPDTKNLRQEMSSRLIIILYPTIEIMQKNS